MGGGIWVQKFKIFFGVTRTNFVTNVTLTTAKGGSLLMRFARAHSRHPCFLGGGAPGEGSGLCGE